MDAKHLLGNLKGAGFTITTDGLKLFIDGPSDKMTPELRESIRREKWALVALVADTMPSHAELIRICRPAVTGTGVDTDDLAAWLLAQDDPGWCTPKAARRWAEIIGQRGWGTVKNPRPEAAPTGR